MVWDVFEWIVIYFYVVETKGLTLEEITEVRRLRDALKINSDDNGSGLRATKSSAVQVEEIKYRNRFLGYKARREDCTSCYENVL